MTNLIFTDGAKSFGIPAHLDPDVNPDAWVFYGQQPTTDADLLYRRVPWLYRAVNLVAGGLTKIPWELRNLAGDVVDTEDDYKDVTGLLPNPEAMFQIVCKALQLYGRCYFLRVRNRARVLRLQYLSPSTISWEVAKDAKGSQLINAKTGKPVILFTRQLENGQRQEYTEDDIIYFWPTDPSVEVGPPLSWPAMAALTAAGVMNNLDSMLAAYFQRGMIKPMVVSVSAGVSPAERERVENWLSRMWTGLRNSFQPKVINADKLSFETIGQDLSEVADLALDENKRRAIAAAIGVPYTKLFSGAATGLGGGGVATQDDVSFYNETVVPMVEFIADTINEQLLNPLGYTWVILPEQMDIYQEDEASRASALVQIASALAQPEQFVIASMIVGIEIPPEAQVMLDKWLEQKQANRDRMAQQLAPKPEEPEEPEPEEEEPEPEDNESETTPPQFRSLTTDHDLWFWKACKAVRDGKAPCVTFSSEMIPEPERRRITQALKRCDTIADVSAVFYAHDSGDVLASELRASRELLERLAVNSGRDSD